MSEPRQEMFAFPSSSFGITRRQFLKNVGLSAFVGLVTQGLPSPLLNFVHNVESERLGNNIGNYEIVAKNILERNTREWKIIPSTAYANGEWTRDGTWSILGLQDINLGLVFFKRFLQKQIGTGQIPTCILDDGTVAINDDESTPAIVLLGYFLKKNGCQFSRREDDALKRALQYCESHLDEKGFWRTVKGGAQTWHDTIVFSDGDVPSYTQGVVSAAFEAGKRLFPQDNNYETLSEKVRNTYNALYSQRSGVGQFLPLSIYQNDVVDVSSLFGEFLSLLLFNRPLLHDDVVIDTLNSFSEANSVGYKVLSRIDGLYLPQEQFDPPGLNPPGTYHNGGSWCAYDLASLLAAHYHGKDAIGKINERIESELKYKKTLWEYLDTNPESKYFGKADESREGYSWNIVCLPLLKRLLSEQNDSMSCM